MITSKTIAISSGAAEDNKEKSYQEENEMFSNTHGRMK